MFNGGAWLQIEGRWVDVHYRDLDTVEHELAEAQAGRFRIEPLLFHLALQHAVDQTYARCEAAVPRSDRGLKLSGGARKSSVSGRSWRPVASRHLRDVGARRYGAAARSRRDMEPVAGLAGVTLDCPHPREFAEFYQRIGGGDILFSSETSVYLSVGGVGLGFQQDSAYRAPNWPEPDMPQQIHVDFRTGELDRSEAAVLAAGAVRPARQPNPDVWRVLLDPAGHPFCLSSYDTSTGPRSV